MFDDKNHQNEYNQGKTDIQMEDAMTIIIVIMICALVLLAFSILLFGINYVSLNWFDFDIMKYIKD